MGHGSVAHGLQEPQGPADIHIPVSGGLPFRFADQRQGCEVNDRFRSCLPHGGAKSGAVAHVAFD
jgi:hypothetical protein